MGVGVGWERPVGIHGRSSHEPNQQRKTIALAVYSRLLRCFSAWLFHPLLFSVHLVNWWNEQSPILEQRWLLTVLTSCLREAFQFTFYCAMRGMQGVVGAVCLLFSISRLFLIWKRELAFGWHSSDSCRNCVRKEGSTLRKLSIFSGEVAYLFRGLLLPGRSNRAVWNHWNRVTGNMRAREQRWQIARPTPSIDFVAPSIKAAQVFPTTRPDHHCKELEGEENSIQDGLSCWTGCAADCEHLSNWGLFLFAGAPPGTLLQGRFRWVFIWFDYWVRVSFTLLIPETPLEALELTLRAFIFSASRPCNCYQLYESRTRLLQPSSLQYKDQESLQRRKRNQERTRHRVLRTN